MPGTPTVPDGLPIILDIDSPDIPRDMNNLSNSTQNALIKKGVPSFPDAATADAWYAIWATPAPGMVRFLQVPGIYQKFSEGQWVWTYFYGVRRDTPLALGLNTPAKVEWTTVEPQPSNTTGMSYLLDEVKIPTTGLYVFHCAGVFQSPPGVPIEARIRLIADNTALAYEHSYVPSGWDHNFSAHAFRPMLKDAIVRIEVTASAAGSNLLAAAMRIMSAGSI